MNLSHVERYFADLLSAIESGEEIPRWLKLPDNLFIIGTVNVDETTYMFSPKVLDRANVIEFRLEPNEMDAFLAEPKAPNLEELDGKGAHFGQAFVTAATGKDAPIPAAVDARFKQEMLLFFNLLRVQNAEFGYRTAYELARFVHFYHLLGGFADDDSSWFEVAMDAIIVQKFLPKLYGSRSRLEGLLWAMLWACGADREGKDFAAELQEASLALNSQYDPERLAEQFTQAPGTRPCYPLSFDKLMRMWRKLVREQFVNFAEA